MDAEEPTGDDASSFASQFDDALVIDSEGSDDSGEGQREDGGFGNEGQGDDVIPSFDISELQEVEVGFTKAKVSEAAQKARENAALRVGENKGNPLEELRAVFKATGGLKLSRDFTERYLYKINADGYHVGWCQLAGNDYDFYNTKHEIIHSVERSEVPQLADPKLLGSGEPSQSTLTDIKKAYGIKAEPLFEPDISKGYMFRVGVRDGKQLGWACKSGRDVEFFDMKGKSLLKVPQRSIPKLATGKRDIMKEVRRCYKVEKVGVRLMQNSTKGAKFKYRVVEQTEKEKEVGFANISSGYFIFFDKEGKKRLHAISRHEMPKKDTWKGHTKSFGISRELKSTAVGAEYSEKGTKPQGIFGLLDPTEIPGYDASDKTREPKLDDKKDKKKKKKKPKKEKKKPVEKVVYRAGLF